jgi:sugar lactone lactonase YvrE
MSRLQLPQIECVLPAAALLGESPVWCAQDNALYWVDIKRPAIHRFCAANGSCQTWPIEEEVTAIGLREAGGAIVSLRSSLATFDFHTGEVSKLPGPIFHQSDMRFNDGRCDRRGRFWVGTLHEARHPETASLYRFESDGRSTEMVAGVTVSNGIAWSLDNRIMYFADSWTRTIFRFDFDLDSGTLRNQRIFVQLPEGAGSPDGATVDAEGFLWSATYDGGCVTRYAPDGSTDRVIKMPVQRPTSCAFGGEDLSILYVTSASLGLTEKQRLDAPLAGGLFAIDAGVTGLPEPRFAG